MPIADGYACVYARGVKTDTATTDAAVIKIPNAGQGYAVRRVTFYKSRVGSTGATASNATTTFGVFGAAAGANPVIVANAALATLTGITVVAEATVAATALTPIVTATDLYVRVGTASGVAGSVIDVAIEYSALP